MLCWQAYGMKTPPSRSRAHDEELRISADAVMTNWGTRFSLSFCRSREGRNPHVAGNTAVM